MKKKVLAFCESFCRSHIYCSSEAHLILSQNILLLYSPNCQLYSFALLPSRRAKRAGWPKGLKGPEGTFRPFGPVGALRRRLLHRNGTFVPPAPSTPLRRQVKTDFRRKWAVAGPFFHQSGRFQGVRRPKFRCGRSHQFDFSRCTPETGRFGRFSGPSGAKWNIHFLHLTQKERCTGRAECTQVTLFSYDCWVS